jgi:methyl-accepting chemotaxis protein
MNNLKVSVRLTIGFASTLLLLAAIAWLSVDNTKSLKSNQDEIVNDLFPKVIWSSDISEQVNITARAMRNVLLVKDPAQIQQEMARIPEARKAIQESIAKLKGKVRSETGTALLNQLQAANTKYIQAQDETLKKIAANKHDEAVAYLLGDVRQAQTGLMDVAHKLIDHQVKKMEKQGLTTTVAADESIQATLLLAGLALALAMGLGYAISRSIVQPLARARDIAADLARGHLDFSAEDSRKDELGELLAAFRSVQAALRTMAADTLALAQAAIEGRLHTRADPERHAGEYRRIVESMNLTLDYLVGYLDRMPLPAMMIDKERNIRYINQRGAELGQTSAQQVRGQKCFDHFKTGDCHTGNCACLKAMGSGAQVQGDTTARPGNLELDINYIGMPVKDQEGAVIGAFEVVMDQTEIKKAQRLAAKVATYQAKEVAKVQEALVVFWIWM